MKIRCIHIFKNLAFFLGYVDSVQPFYGACANNARHNNTEWVSMVTIEGLNMVICDKLNFNFRTEASIKFTKVTELHKNSRKKVIFNSAVFKILCTCV
jgi:hypothetical protein